MTHDTAHDLTSRDLDALGGPAALMEREWAPCRHACPVHADVRVYIEHLAQGRWREAIDVIRDNLPFASVCGRICHHPCEANCRRDDVDEAVAIRELKRFVSELRGAAGATVHKAPKQDKARVAIIGSGPAGMAAALDLAKKGYRPTVFERAPVAGGIPATAIPPYRLPREVLQVDIDWICAHGVELITGVEIGRDKTVDGLLADGFACVLIATGLPNSRMLPLPGADSPRVFPALDFLGKLAFGQPVEIGRDVLVIGGGNVACDAARSAVRLGADRVRMMCLESAGEMPAFEWEIREAAEEGVQFVNRRGPVEITGSGGGIQSVTARAVTRVFDAEGRFSPEYNDGDVVTLDCDTVIVAIGQMADFGFVEGSGLRRTEAGRLTFDPATHQTNRDNVFACGEIVTPPGSAVEACASGQRAAEAIDLYLSKRPIELDDTIPPVIDEIDSPAKEKVVRVPRADVPTEPAETRRCRFDEVDHNLDEATVLREARRCMSCGSGAEVLTDLCAACLTCLRVCPFGVPVVTDVARIRSTLCQACGICVAACPAGAIVAKGHALRDLESLIAERMKRVEPGVEKIVAFVSGHRADAPTWRGETVAGQPGLVRVVLPSLARLSEQNILRAFELGAERVVVAALAPSAERYPEATQRARLRVDRARRLLEEAGYAPEAVSWVDVDESAAEHPDDALRKALAG